MGYKLDYDAAIMLDAEDLAEGGVKEAYDEEVLPRLRDYVPSPVEVIDVANHDEGTYAVRCGDREFRIYGFEDSEEDSWGVAMWVLFDIVNSQLEGAPVRFYAINGGNELLGIFLSPEECQAARDSLPNKRDWPYLPEPNGPNFGWPG